MEKTCVWRCLRLTRAGMIRYEVWCTPGPEPYGAYIAVRGQSAEVCGVTADRVQMIQWMRTMAMHGVRPCHLRDVLEELLLR